MLANHTKISSLFERSLKEFDKLYNRKAFVDGFRPHLEEDLSEFQNSRDTVHELIEEYKAATRPDYVEWGFQRQEQLQKKMMSGVS